MPLTKEQEQEVLAAGKPIVGMTAPGGIKLDELTHARLQLDQGKIKVSEFLEQARPIAQSLLQDLNALSTTGADGANAARTVLGSPTFQATGFAVDPAAPDKIQVALPQEFEQALRQELLPGNLPEEERQRILETIPEDIGFETGRFELEREGIRQRLQAEEAARKAEMGRATRLQELAGILGEHEERLFEEARPRLAEEAQAQGLFETTAFGEALARERGRLGAATQEALALQGLAGQEQAIRAQERAAGLQRQFQTAGLQRQFGTEDEARQFSRQMQMAQMVAAQDRGGGKGGGTAGGALSGAAALGTINPWLAIPGAIAGGYAGSQGYV